MRVHVLISIQLFYRVAEVELETFSTGIDPPPHTYAQGDIHTSYSLIPAACLRNSIITIIWKLLHGFQANFTHSFFSGGCRIRLAEKVVNGS